MRFLVTMACFFCVNALFGQNQIKIAKLKYNGGGDWYANKTALPNLIKFSNREIGTNLKSDEDVVEVGSSELYTYPYVYMTGQIGRASCRERV